MPPLFGEMWACPNRKMNMHVEYETEKAVAKKWMKRYVLFTIWTGNGKNDTKSKKKVFLEKHYF